MRSCETILGVGVDIAVTIDIVIRNLDRRMVPGLRINSEPIAIPTPIPSPTPNVEEYRSAQRSTSEYGLQGLIDYRERENAMDLVEA